MSRTVDVQQGGPNAMPVRLVRAASAYVPKRYAGRVACIVAIGDDGEANRDLGLGWQTVAGGGLEVRVVPGNHETFRQEPNVRILAKELKDLLGCTSAARNGESEGER
jgi:hypothetical protein